MWKYFKDTGKEPILGQKVGRPKKPYIRRDAEIVREAHSRYKFGARMLERVIRKQYKICISHNRIHMYLKKEGLAREEPRKKRRRKWNRYERKHSLSAGHIDWHEMDGHDIKVCIILDDASRKVLAGGEFSLASTLRTAD
jgi:putative transposase